MPIARRCAIGVAAAALVLLAPACSDKTKNDVRNTTSLFQQRIVSDTVTTTTGETPYVRFGEWVVAVSALLLLGAAVASRVRRPRATFPRLAAEEREPVGSGRVT